MIFKVYMKIESNVLCLVTSDEMCAAATRYMPPTIYFILNTSEITG